MLPKTYLENVICDQCGKKTVIETIENPWGSQKPTETPMSSYQGSGGGIITNAVYRPLTHNLKCDTCGNTRTFNN